MQDLIDTYLELFHLNKKADQRELDIAYETLTKNAVPSEICEYRKAYEYLMCNFYNAVEIKEEVTEEDIHKEFLNNTPTIIRNCVNFFETTNNTELSIKEKNIWSSTKVNLPMLYCSLIAGVVNFCGIKFIPLKNIKKIINKACLNPLEYHTTIFELSTNDPEEYLKQKELYKFCIGLKNILDKDIYDIKYFNISETRFGVIGTVISESDTDEHIQNLLMGKCKQLDCKLNISTTNNLETTDIEQDENEKGLE